MRISEEDFAETPDEQLTETAFNKVKRDCPFETPFTRTPDPAEIVLEEKLSTFNRFVLNLLNNEMPQKNLTLTQRKALHELKLDPDLHISVSDKCGELVVTEKKTHKELTLRHLQETPVYEQIMPTKKFKEK